MLQESRRKVVTHRPACETFKTGRRDGDKTKSDAGGELQHAGAGVRQVVVVSTHGEAVDEVEG